MAPEISSGPSEGIPLSVQNETSVKIASPDARKMIIAPYEQKIYNYVYSGSGFSVNQKEMSVLQKKKNTLSPSEAQGLLKNFSLSNINLGSFTSLSIGSINLMEEKEYGLGLTIDFNE